MVAPVFRPVALALGYPIAFSESFFVGAEHQTWG